MARFASRDLSFVSLSEIGLEEKTTGNTQQCEDASGNKACTCCTNDTSNANALADDRDREALHQQLLATTS
jgi:hypothetical protein